MKEKIWRKQIFICLFAKSKILTAVWRMHTAESNFSNFVIKYLGKIKTEFKNTLACLSETQMGSNHEKIGGLKSHDTLPLTLI